MINALIDMSLGNRFLVLVCFALLGGWGYWALLTTPIDAIPDLSDNQVIVFTDWPGRSPQEVEDQVTYPLTVSLQGLPGVRVVRSSSTFGFSMINIIFEDAVDLYFVRTQVLERLNLLAKSLPPDVVPTLGPDATGVGHVFWYTVDGQGYSLRDLHSLQDWFIRYQLNAVPGVAEVASGGGGVRQYQIDVDPNRLAAIGVLVDAAIVVTENAFRFMETHGVNPRNRRQVTETVLAATRLVGRPIFFSMAIITLAFIPVFALTGQEGKLFYPLAFTKSFAMLGATLLSVTLVPMLCSLLIGGKIRGEEDNPVMRPLMGLYRSVLGWALRHRALALWAAVFIFVGALTLTRRGQR